MATTSNGEILDPGLAADGLMRIAWASKEMPVLSLIRERFSKEQPLKGLRVSACLHVTTETANLAITLRDGGADVVLCASNPLSTQDDVAAALLQNERIPVYAIRGEDNSTYYRHIHSALDHRPHITLDDGADLVATIHQNRTELIEGITGGTEETTTGVIRLKSLARAGRLRYPIIAVNEANTKHLFDNRYGTGQSTIDGITRATNILWAGKKVVVVGFGWCGRGVASRARGLGAQVIVTEVDPVRALEALMEGFQVLPISDAALVGDIFITVTGNLHVIDGSHLESMKDGAIIANSGHFNLEINIDALEEMSDSKSKARSLVDEYTMKNGKRVYLLAEGRLINLSAAEGHPSSVMDMSFANQALSVEHLATLKEPLGRDVYPVPQSIDEEVGRLKLNAIGIKIDTPTAEQLRYMESWEIGT